jgi:hypothetical protein
MYVITLFIYANDIVSGKYGGSSNPTQGYLGNMMTLHNYVVNVTENRTYFVQAQAIDAGLSAGNWSDIQVYDPYGDELSNVALNTFEYGRIITSHITIVGGNMTLLNSSADAINLNSGSLNLTNSNVSNLVANATVYSSNALIGNLIINRENLSLYDSTVINATVNSSGVVFYNTTTRVPIWGEELGCAPILILICDFFICLSR